MAARQTRQMEYLFHGSGSARRLAHDQWRSAARDQQGPCEEVDPIDAAIAVTSKKGLRMRKQDIIADPQPLNIAFPNTASACSARASAIRWKKP